MKKLFDDNYRYTDAASAIDNETNCGCRNIMNNWVDAGYSPREICYIMQQAINDLSLDKLLCLKVEGGNNENKI